MSKETQIKVIEKPDYISWDAIHDCLWEAHAKNREQGIFMKYPSMKGEEIKEKVGDGTFFVALDGDKVVGTAAMLSKKPRLWCGETDEEYAYFCFASVLPAYSGLGIYKSLCELREEIAKAKGYTKILYDTNEKNMKQLSIALRNGYHKVGIKYYQDHFNVLMVKWLAPCPYSDATIRRKYLVRRVKAKIRVNLKGLLGR